MRMLPNYKIMTLPDPKCVSDVMNLTLDAVCVVGENGVFLSVSGAHQRIFGYTAQEMIGRQILDLIYEPDLGRTLEAFGKLIQGLLPPGFENRYRRKDGSIAYITWSARWYKDKRICVAVARDVTEERISKSPNHDAAVAMHTPVGGNTWRLSSAPPSLTTPSGKTVKLSTQDYVVLLALAAGNQQLVSRRDIVQAMGKDFLEYDQRRLDSQIWRLRRKVEQATCEQLPITTLRSMGYRCYEEIFIQR
ncbi:PAS domain S-box protein [Pusillimonas sp. NJUB218]|uniref:PAS domain S-box protein n=1 Tax=Pusillimonas sp. NJUB218 TaxID=2023230 RepID=UPI001F34104D|nr:PAS domain S-box protein [Pusillimonas sp. NJUB218]